MEEKEGTTRMKLKGTRATYAACVLCAVFTPVILAPVNESKQLDASLPLTTFGNSANIASFALANLSALGAADKPSENNMDNQQPPGNSAPTVIGPSSADNPPAEKPSSTVDVKKEVENVVTAEAQETVVDKSVPPSPESQSPDSEASAKKDNADQGQGPPPPPPAPRESETQVLEEKKEVAEAADPSGSAPQVLASGSTEAQGGEVKKVNPSPLPSESAMTVGAKPEETQASRISDPEIPQETQNKANETQGLVVTDEQAQEPQQNADQAKESQPSAVPSEIAQSAPVEPPKLPEQSAAETQEPKPVKEETQKPDVSEVAAQVPKEPEQQAENTQDSDAVVEQPKEQEQTANETQEQPEQLAVDEEAKGTDTEDNLIEENINNDDENREQYENDIAVVDKPINDYSYTMDSSQQSSMATDMQANNPSFSDQLGKDSEDGGELTIKNREIFTDDEDSHFFAYFLTIMVSAIIFYLVFHNKQRIIALIIEGRSPGERRGRRSSSRGKYHKLDNNLEEAITATKGAKRH
ncbi:trans-Golgi network integral membrane protein 1-like isoform X2 [Penaeus monodon]|uniref:trans-Golgi network integral membrane protein 1-like isoform X2 n=1 Tax=Penaeus monodon TaxID=6687 RepID=UPI0018A7468D|nr:trans-Golgi network integral membrane protein 1-like isoform X2 [Penaeus monodon]